MRRFSSGRGSGIGRMARFAAVAAAAAMTLAACGSQDPVVVTETVTPGADQPSNTVQTVPSLSDDAHTETTSPSSDASTTSAAEVRVSANPAFGSDKVGPRQEISLTAFNGTFQDVQMTGDDGSTIDGELSSDSHTWTKTDRLDYGVTYTIKGTAVASDGSQQPFDGTLTTAKPKSTMAAYVQIPNDTTVGVAAPIVVTFAGAVSDRAAAQKQLHVTTTDADGNDTDVTGSWGWMPDEDIQGDGTMQSRVHFRPKEYWPAHTKVHLEADLYGVDYGDGSWGREDITRDFQIGDDLVVKADVDSHRLLVLKNGEVLKNYPVSYGKESIPGRATVSGIHIVQDKKPGEFTMCNLDFGYCGVKEYWGVRINNNGEFIHVNKQTEAAGKLGKANVSHGCVNMSMKDGKEFFDMVYYGVPVDIENTGTPMTERDYVWDWSYSWSQWQGLSAL